MRNVIYILFFIHTQITSERAQSRGFSNLSEATYVAHILNGGK